jgi:Tfp pilus assembly protein PilO
VTAQWRPWRRLIAVWLPAVATCILLGAAFVWQATGAAGREERVVAEVDELQAELERLMRIRAEAGSDRAAVGELDRHFKHLYDDVFGNLDERLTRILRSVHAATRGAGLQPGSFGYSAVEDRKLRYVRFGIQFSISGEYGQLRQLLSALQASPEFLIVETIAISGDSEGTNRSLNVGIRVATYLAEADAETLRRLTGGIRAAETNDDAADQG